MTGKEFKTLKEGPLKVGKHQIYFSENEGLEPGFVVERFEFVEGGQDMFSVVDLFDTFEQAYTVALDPTGYLRKAGLVN